MSSHQVVNTGQLTLSFNVEKAMENGIKNIKDGERESGPSGKPSAAVTCRACVGGGKPRVAGICGDKRQVAGEGRGLVGRLLGASAKKCQVRASDKLQISTLSEKKPRVPCLQTGRLIITLR